MTTLHLKAGQTIETKDGRQGLVRYVGAIHIAEGEWLGLELPDASGKNDGSVKGERYFTCQQNFGIFVRKESVVKILRQPSVSASTAPARINGELTGSAISGTRPRPGGGITPEIARKRQSLMSAGSTAAPTNRMSLRSPTKSPTKPHSSAASVTDASATSTPRTGTPATTARTSDSSAKSRMSVSSRSSIAPVTSGPRTATNASRLSLTGGPQRQSRPSSISTKPLLGSKRISAQSKPSSTLERRRPESQQGDESSHTTPPLLESNRATAVIDESEHTEDIDEAKNDLHDVQDDKASIPAPENTALSRANRTASISRPNVVGTAESRAILTRDNEQLKARIRFLEKQRQDDEGKLQQHESVHNENERYKNIIQALQTKIRSNQQELMELRSKYEKAQVEAQTGPDRSAEHESEMELATLDREMAEERAETIQMELDALKVRHEELELEVEILREENQELGSVMSPEEKSSAGWLQMEREKERLREALLILRDMTQETESNLKAEIQELQANCEELEPKAIKYSETAQKLLKAQETNRHLMEQLEAADSNDEIVEAMETQREQHINAIEQLKKQIQEFEEHIQVTDELENFHLEEEKRLHSQLDEAEAFLNESQRQNSDKERSIEDLEYTLKRFRDIVQGQQSDIEQLRRSRDISEIEANEMSSKSRAMMDLNLRLQSNTAKSQSKHIDAELAKVQARVGTEHVNILNLYTIESFESDKNSILTLLCFQRVRFKSKLVCKLLLERLRERSHLAHGEEIFHIFELVEQMSWIAGICQRFESFMSTCSVQEFSACGGALYDLEPVDRTINGWLEALRKDELSSDGPEHLKRLQGVLIDLSDKLLIDNDETRSTQLIVQADILENLMESLAGQMVAFTQLVQSKLGRPKDEDEESSVFDKKMDQMLTKSRTMKYLSHKVVSQLTDMQKNSLCLAETSWILFEETERQAGDITQLFRRTCLAIIEDLFNSDLEEPPSYTSLIDRMTSAFKQLSTQSTEVNGNLVEGDIFALLATRTNALQLSIDDLIVKSSDLGSVTEFESKVAPWIVRSKELKLQKIIAPEVQDEITRLERRNQELGSRISEREKTIEEMTMRVELAEKRMKDSRARDDKDKASQEEVNRLSKENEEKEKLVERLKSEIESHGEKAEQTRIELEALRRLTHGEPLQATGVQGITDEKAIKQANFQVTLLEAEMAALQSTIRFLREDNRALRVPVTDTLINSAKHTWLESPMRSGCTQGTTSVKTSQKTDLEQEAKDIYSDLIHIATSLKPVRLSSKAKQDNGSTIRSSTSWQPTSQKTRYTVLKQQEEWEDWLAQRNDFVQKAKIINGNMRVKVDHSDSRQFGQKAGELQYVRQQSSQNRPKGKRSNLIPLADENNTGYPRKPFVDAAMDDHDATNPGAIRIVET